MNKIVLSIFLLGSMVASAQQKDGVTFEIETLKRPPELLKEWGSDEIIKKFAPKELAYSKMPEKMVDALSHPFFDGMYMAYSDHRPFVISPDMIWLLICQGFSHHVNNNAEALRSMFVNFDGKKSLIVTINESQPLDNLSTWEGVIPKFIQEVSDNTSKELMTTLTPEFSTTTSAEKIATQITALESMRVYFEYIVVKFMCGIPKLTIRGTPQDWQLLKDRTDSLRKYKLDWWVDELDPLLDKFIEASNGKFDTGFWRNMFKYHNDHNYGAPLVIDGWIIKFFPYDKKGKRNDFKMLRSSENLPDECALVDFKLMEEKSGGNFKTRDMQFMAGFFGLKQNSKTQALEPIIGWLVTPKEEEDDHKHDIVKDSKDPLGINISVSEIPQTVLDLKSIVLLNVNFTDSIKIPKELSLVKIQTLTLFGKTTDEESSRILHLFPSTEVIINNKHYDHSDGKKE